MSHGRWCWLKKTRRKDTRRGSRTRSLPRRRIFPFPPELFSPLNARDHAAILIAEMIFDSRGFEISAARSVPRGRSSVASGEGTTECEMSGDREQTIDFTQSCDSR